MIIDLESHYVGFRVHQNGGEKNLGFWFCKQSETFLFINKPRLKWLAPSRENFYFRNSQKCLYIWWSMRLLPLLERCLVA